MCVSSNWAADSDAVPPSKKDALVTQVCFAQLTVWAECLPGPLECEEKMIRGADKLRLCIC